MSHTSHPKCEHKLEFCGQCDIVFCGKCKEEWKKSHYNWNYPWYNTGVTYYCGTGGDLTIGNSEGTVEYKIHTH